MLVCQIESITFDELLAYMSLQGSDSFPSFKDESWLQTFVTKLYNYAEFCLCRDNSKLIGMIAFYANGQEAYAYISHVYVSSDYRHIGLFSRMLSIVEEYIQYKGFDEIRLEVDDDNFVAQQCYLTNGFEIMDLKKPSSHSKYMRKIKR